jgi:hypothetical protein
MLKTSRKTRLSSLTVWIRLTELAVDWRYHIGNDVSVTIKAPFPFVHIRKHFIPADEWTYRPTKRGVALHFREWKELKQIIPLLEEREPELRLTSDMLRRAFH